MQSDEYCDYYFRSNYFIIFYFQISKMGKNFYFVKIKQIFNIWDDDDEENNYYKSNFYQGMGIVVNILFVWLGLSFIFIT